MALPVQRRGVTLSAALLSKLTLPARRPPGPEPLRRCGTRRRTAGVVDVVLPATVLSDATVAKWVRDRAVAVEVRNGRELPVALDAGIHPARMTVHGDGLSADELVFCAGSLRVGRLVVCEAGQVDVLGGVGRRGQRVLVGARRRGLADAVIGHKGLDLVGLYGEIGPDAHHFVSHPAAIGDLVADMTSIRRDHGVVLTRIALGGPGLAFGAGPGELSGVANAIDETLDDACATLRFPRPVVVVSARPANMACTPAPSRSKLDPWRGADLRS
ncbi:LysA protein [Mycobacterium sp. NPDC003449]